MQSIPRFSHLLPREGVSALFFLLFCILICCRIDALAVIRRLVHIFKEHPALIQGFNNFLPVGYRIQCSTEAGLVTITAPDGETMQTTMWTEGGQATPSFVSGVDLIILPDDPAREFIYPVRYLRKAELPGDRDTHRQFREIRSWDHGTLGPDNNVRSSDTELGMLGS